MTAEHECTLLTTSYTAVRPSVPPCAAPVARLSKSAGNEKAPVRN